MWDAFLKTQNFTIKEWMKLLALLQPRKLAAFEIQVILDYYN